MRSLKLVAAAFASSLFFAMPARAAWTVTAYDVPGSDLTRLWGVNNGGVVVGEDDFGGIIIDHGVVTTVVAPEGGSSTGLTGIADSGLAVGNYYDASFHTHAFLYRNGAFTPFALPAGSDVLIRSISADGHYIAGTYTSSANANQGFVYDLSTATLTQLPLGSNGAIGTVQGVNNLGQVTGSFSSAVSFVYDLSTNTARTITADGLDGLHLRAINDNGLLAGAAIDSNGLFVGIIGTTATGFDTLVAGTDGSDGYTLVYGLNDSGEAVGYYADAEDNYHGFIATSAVPEPATGALVVGGIAMLGALRRRRGH